MATNTAVSSLGRRSDQGVRSQAQPGTAGFGRGTARILTDGPTSWRTLYATDGSPCPDPLPQGTYNASLVTERAPVDHGVFAIPATTRSRLMLEVASELVGDSTWPQRQVNVSLREQGAERWP